MKKIVIINRCCTDNLGDRIIGHAMQQLFQAEGTVTHLDYTFKRDNRTHGKVFRLIEAILAVFHAIWSLLGADLVIIGGGELISNNANFYKSLKIWDALICYFAVHSKKAVFSCGVVDNFENPTRLIEILNHFDAIFTRDNYSKELLQKWGLKHDMLEVMPDCVFAFNPPKQETERRNQALVGITDNGRLAKHKYYSLDENAIYYEKVISELSSRYDKVLLVYNTQNDYKHAQQFYEKFKRQYSKLSLAQINDEYEFLALIQSSAYLISPRMHALILALISNIDCTPVVISTKMKNFKELYFPIEAHTVTSARSRVLTAANKLLELH